MPELQVRKRDGRMEPFMRDKILNGVVKSGGTPEQAENITAEIEKWAPTAAAEGVINSSDIRVKLLELLRVENPAAADQFESYKKEGTAPAAPAAPAEPEPPAEPAAPVEPAPGPVPPAVE